MLLLGRVLHNCRLPGGRRLLFKVVLMCSETFSITASERLEPNDIVDPRVLSGWLSRDEYVWIYANGLIFQIILSSQSLNLRFVAFEQHFEQANMMPLCTVLNQVCLWAVVLCGCFHPVFLRFIWSLLIERFGRLKLIEDFLLLLHRNLI